MSEDSSVRLLENYGRSGDIGNHDHRERGSVKHRETRGAQSHKVKSLRTSPALRHTNEK